MSELLPITLLSFVLAGISHLLSVKDGPGRGYRKKEWVIYLIMTVIMIFFVGLRTRYNDTAAYIHAFELLDSTQTILESVPSWSIGNNPGFNLVNGVLIRWGFSAQSYLMFYAVITVGLYTWFIRKYTCNIWFSIFLFITIGVYTFTLAAIKQCVAVAFALIGVDAALRKRWVPFVLFVLLAATFHPYALMFLIAPFMTYKPWTGRGYIVLAFFLLLGLFLTRLIGGLVSITSMMGEEYDVSSFTGEGINPFRLAVCAVPLVLSFAGQKVVRREGTEADNLMINFSLLNAEIMFVGLFGTANYFGRLANYFLIFQCLSIPWLMRVFTRRSAKVVTGLAVAGYLLYFYYANAINQSFDAGFDRITLLQYLGSLF